jgi:excisionase family DNA binding protein
MSIKERMTIDQMTDHFGVCRATIYAMVRRGELPSSIKVGRRVFWNGSSVKKAEQAAIAKAERNIKR